MEPSQPSTPTPPMSTPQTPAPPEAQQPQIPNPSSSVTQPTLIPAAGQIPEKAAKNIRTAAISGIVLGVLMIAVGIGLAIFYDVAAVLNAIFGIVYIVCGVKLKSAKNNMAQILTSLKVIIVTLLVNFMASLLSGSGAGFLTLLMAYFAISPYKPLFEAGLITSQAPLRAKPKV
jgi:hypothetical protein